MTTKTLQVSLGSISLGQRLVASGWYTDPATGQRYYYDVVQNQWYVSVGGYLYPLSIIGGIPMDPAPKQVPLALGEKLKITLRFLYTGPAVPGVVSRYAIGVYGAGGFDEKVYVASTLNIPANLTTIPVEVKQDATLTLPLSGIVANCDDIYVKISTATWEYFHGYENALIIVGLQPSITEFKILDFSKV
jgi:hypothetical protein